MVPAATCMPPAPTTQVRVPAPPDPTPAAPPAIVAVDMGYGHLRAAAALAAACGQGVLEADHAPLADAKERRSWKRLRGFYLWLSRAAGAPVLGRLVHPALDAMTAIPRMRRPGQGAAPNLSVRYLDWLAACGFERGLLDHLRRTGAPLLTTFYSPAILADRAGFDGVTSVVTDADVNRVWVAADPARSRIRFCVPARRTERRLLSYGVPADRIHVTGFPLPPSLLGGRDLRARDAALAARLLRLDPGGDFRRRAGPAVERFLAQHAPDGATPGVPPRVTFAVGGAGAQAHVGLDLLAALAPLVRAGEVALSLVAGTRRRVNAKFRAAVEREGLSGPGGVEVLSDTTFSAYEPRFNALLARTDVLWTKPSELAFFGALGLPLAFSDPLGAQEVGNRRWAARRGAAVLAPPAAAAVDWLRARLADGSLAQAAWDGASRMPALGTYRILDLVRRG
jgi:hypothetical protein